MPEDFTTAAQRATSVRSISPNCSGVVTASSTPSACTRARTAGSSRTRAISRWSRWTISRGVPAGATRPYQDCVSNPGNPDSATVGTSGYAFHRRGLVNASICNCPARTNGSAVAGTLIVTGTTPATTSLIAALELAYGTCSNSTLARDHSMTAER